MDNENFSSLNSTPSEEKPDGGEFFVGDTAKIAYVDQSHSNIDPEKTIWQNFSDEQELIMMGGKQVNSREYFYNITQTLPYN